MMKFIPDKHFEIAGTVFGLLASVSISTQVYAEVCNDGPSTVSVVYAVDFLVIFAFWTLYGVRFSRVAMWLTNGIATLVQALLVIVIVLKQLR